MFFHESINATGGNEDCVCIAWELVLLLLLHAGALLLFFLQRNDNNKNDTLLFSRSGFNRAGGTHAS